MILIRCYYLVSVFVKGCYLNGELNNGRFNHLSAGLVFFSNPQLLFLLIRFIISEPWLKVQEGGTLKGIKTGMGKLSFNAFFRHSGYFPISGVR